MNRPDQASSVWITMPSDSAMRMRSDGGGKFWFYWIAPLLMLGLGGILISLTIGYWLKVGRLAVKGRPRSD